MEKDKDQIERKTLKETHGVAHQETYGGAHQETYGGAHGGAHRGAHKEEEVIQEQQQAQEHKKQKELKKQEQEKEERPKGVLHSWRRRQRLEDDIQPLRKDTLRDKLTCPDL